jgi:hypothetical protein
VLSPGDCMHAGRAALGFFFAAVNFRHVAEYLRCNVVILFVQEIVMAVEIVESVI